MDLHEHNWNRDRDTHMEYRSRDLPRPQRAFTGQLKKKQDGIHPITNS